MTQQEKDYAISMPMESMTNLNTFKDIHRAINIMAYETPDGEPYNHSDLNHKLDFKLSWQAYQRAVYASKMSHFLS